MCWYLWGSNHVNLWIDTVTLPCFSAIISTSLAIMFSWTDTFLLVENKVKSISCKWQVQKPVTFHRPFNVSYIDPLLNIIFSCFSINWTDVNPNPQQTQLGCCVLQRPVMYYSVNKFATCIEKRLYSRALFGTPYG